MIRRTLDAAFLNSVANHPEVFPWIGAEKEIDLTDIVSNPANFALVTEYGGWVFVRHDAGTYELHTLILPEGRGRHSLKAWKEAARYMFCRTDAREIVTRVPEHNKGADFAARACGFKERFARVNAFKPLEGPAVNVSFRALTLDDWWPTDTAVADMGHAFHLQIEAAKGAPNHPDDDTHDRAVGATCLMVLSGVYRKAVWFYNRWALLAGYEPIKFLSDAPFLIDIGNGIIVTAIDGRMEIVKCP